MRVILKFSVLFAALLFFGCVEGTIQNKDEGSDLGIIESEIKNIDKRTDSIRLTYDPENSCRNNDIYWYKNGTLSQSDGNEWVRSEELDRLSTCGGFLYKLSKQKGIDPMVLSDDFIISSRSLMQCIDEYYAFSGNMDTPFNKVAMGCILM